jgi:hypothetical protein
MFPAIFGGVFSNAPDYFFVASAAVGNVPTGGDLISAKTGSRAGVGDSPSGAAKMRGRFAKVLDYIVTRFPFHPVSL